MRPSGEPRFVRTAGLLVGGLLIWAVHFTFIYSWTGLACARPSWGLAEGPFSAAQIVIVAASLIAAAAVVAILPFAWRASDRFIGRTAAAVALLSLLAIALEGSAALLVPACQ